MWVGLLVIQPILWLTIAIGVSSDESNGGTFLQIHKIVRNNILLLFQIMTFGGGLLLKGMAICHLKIHRFGLRIMLSWKQLKSNRSRKKPSQSFPYLPKRIDHPHTKRIQKNSTVIIPSSGARDKKSAPCPSSRQSQDYYIYLPSILLMIHLSFQTVVFPFPSAFPTPPITWGI